MHTEKVREHQDGNRAADVRGSISLRLQLVVLVVGDGHEVVHHVEDGADQEDDRKTEPNHKLPVARMQLAQLPLALPRLFQST